MVEPGRFSIGDVLSDSFGVLGRNFAPFFLLSLIISAPGIIYTYMLINSGGGGSTFDQLKITLIEMLLGSIVTAVVVFGTVQDLRGQRASLGACISRGVTLVFPIFAVILLQAILIGIGLIALIIPGLIIMTVLWVAIPAAVIERPGVIASLGRSATLTKGARWPIFGILFLVAIAAIAIGWVLEKTLIPVPLYSVDGLTNFLLVSWVVDALFSAFTAILAAVGYYHLRMQKEGVEIETLAAVFD